MSEAAAAVAAPRWRDVYVAATARAVSVCGDVMAATALVLALQARGAAGWAVAALFLAAALPMVVMGPFGGRLADRFDSRTILVTVGVAQAAVCTGLAFASHPVVMVGLMAVLATGVSVVQPTLAALTPEMVGRQNLARASGFGQAVNAAGMLVAPALAGVLVGAFGARVPLLIDAVSFLAIVAAGVLIRTRRGGKPPAEGAGAARRRWRLRDEPLIFGLVTAVASVVAVLVVVNVVDVFFVIRTLGSTPQVYGAIVASWTAGILVGGFITGRLVDRWKLPDSRVALLNLGAIAGTALPVALAALVTSAPAMLPLWIVGGLLNGACNVLTVTLIGRRVAGPVRGQGFARFSATANGASVLGYLAAGPLLAVFQPRTLVAACGVAGVLVAGLMLPQVLRVVRRLPQDSGAGSVTVPATG